MVVRRLCVDYERGTMAIELADGTVIAPPGSAKPPQPVMPLRRAICDLVGRELTLTLPDYAAVTVELDTGEGTRPPLETRAVVYLDQRTG